MNFDTNTLTIDCGADLARLDYNYEVNGKLLLLPIVGKGPGFIEMRMKVFVYKTIIINERF